MAILSTKDFIEKLQNNQRIMALDVGTTTIGLATAVYGRDEVMPLKTILRSKFTRDAEALIEIFRDYDVQALVIGWPLLLDGRIGKRCQSVRDFTDELKRFLNSRHIDLPMTFWDERFSTAHGDEMVHSIGKTSGKPVRRDKRDQMIDSLAAQNILENFMSNL